MIFVEAFIKLVILHLAADWWAELDGTIQDKAHRVKRQVQELFNSSKANRLILSLGIGRNKVSRLWLRGLLIASLSISHLDSDYYPILMSLGLSLMWMPLFNPLLANRRSINDNTPELGDYGYEKWLSKRPIFYMVLKIVMYTIGVGLVVIAHATL